MSIRGPVIVKAPARMDETIKETMQHRSTFLVLLVALFAIALLAGCDMGTPAARTPQSVPEERTARLPETALPQTVPPATTTSLANPGPDQGGPAAPGAETVTILLTNDVHGKVDPCG